jgi:GTP cyclohydrolase II
VVALDLPASLLNPAALLTLADPTQQRALPEQPSLAAPRPAGAEAAIGLAKLAHLLPAVLAAPATTESWKVAADLGLLACDAADVVEYQHESGGTLSRVAQANVPLADAPDARIVAFRTVEWGTEHLAVLVGTPELASAPLVRIHSECFTGDLLGSLRCDCGPQMRGALRRMASEGAGVLLYLAQEGRGIGLLNKLRAYTLQDRGLDTIDANHALGWGADERDFTVAGQMLADLGVRRVRLMTNNPEKLAALAAHGVTVVREPHVFQPNGINDGYLATKVARFGHFPV